MPAKRRLVYCIQIRDAQGIWHLGRMNDRVTIVKMYPEQLDDFTDFLLKAIANKGELDDVRVKRWDDVQDYAQFIFNGSDLTFIKASS